MDEQGEFSPGDCMLQSKHDPSPNRMIVITGPVHSLEHIPAPPREIVVDLGLATNPFLKIMPEQADVAGVKEPSWLKQPGSVR